MQGTPAANSNINAWLIEDSLYLSPKTSWEIEPLHIRKAEQIFRIQDIEKPISRSTLQGRRNAIFPFQTNQLNIKLDSNKKIPLKHGINLFKDFSVEGRKTLSLCLGKQPDACRISILKNVEIHSHPQERLQVRAMLGIHRAAGKLVAEISQNETTTKHQIHFSQEHKGGSEEHKYQKAIINLPQISGSASLSIYIEHLKFIPWEKTNRTDSFYFVSDLKITEKSGLPTTILTARIHEGSQGYQTSPSSRKQRFLSFKAATIRHWKSYGVMEAATFYFNHSTHPGRFRA